MLKKYIAKYELNSVEDMDTTKKRIYEYIRKIHEPNTIFSNLPFDAMPKDEQIIYLHYLMTDVPDREAMANFKKMDANRDYTCYIFHRSEKNNSSDIPIPSISDPYSDDISSNFYWESKKIIRDLSISRARLFRYLGMFNQSMAEILTNHATHGGSILVSADCIGRYIDYVNMVVLQVLIYRVRPLPYVLFSSCLQKLTDSLGRIEKVVDQQVGILFLPIASRTNTRQELTAEFTSAIFSKYVAHRSILEEDEKIDTVLENEMRERADFFTAVPDKYHARKMIIPEAQLCNYQEIITEGANIPNYKAKLSATREIITFLQKHSLRFCDPLCVQDIKVYFREIYLSKATYRHKQAQTIVRDYIKRMQESDAQSLLNKEDVAHYRFLLHKITRGYYREVGNLREYREITSFMHTLYHFMVKCYLYYDVEESIQAIYKTHNILLSAFSFLLSF